MTSDRQTNTTHVSVITRSYEPHARVLGDSIARADAGATMTLYVLGGGVDSFGGGIEVMNVEDVLGEKRCAELRRRYSAAEACFALKPAILRDALRRGYEVVHYVDADLYLHRPLDELTNPDEPHDVLLTPHLLCPPRQGNTDHLLTILRAGMINAGFVSIRRSEAADTFLEWWQQCIDYSCDVAPEMGVNGDQRWLDATPYMFPGISVSRHPGANVGYWNLFERHLRGDGEDYLVGDVPLVFFHFSGFEPGNPGRLSRHSPVSTRENPVLQRLVEEYSARLKAAGFVPGRDIKPAGGYRRPFQSGLTTRTASWLVRRLFARHVRGGG